jgi:GTP-binding protein
MTVVTQDFTPIVETSDEQDEQIKIAIVGKPNVGKSSLVNRILGKERSIANPTPGTTRDAIDMPLKVRGKNYLLIDTAGIRKKNKISLTLEKYSVIQALKTINRCNIALVLIDAEEGMTEQDTKIAGLAYERGKACIIVVNKWDKIEKDNSTVGKFVEDIKEKLKFMDFAPIIFVSAITGQRAPKIFDIIEEVYTQYTKRIGTAQLNSLVEKSLQRNPLARFQGREQNISYATQIAVKPPTFVFFVSNIKGIHFSYERYLINQIRANFGFENVPLKIIFRKKR